MASSIVRQKDPSSSFCESVSPSVPNTTSALYTNMRALRIKTSRICPPISTRSFDWSAVDDSTYDGPGSPIGHGTTEGEAIGDLLEQLGIDTRIGTGIAMEIG